MYLQKETPTNGISVLLITKIEIKICLGLLTIFVKNY